MNGGTPTWHVIMACAAISSHLLLVRRCPAMTVGNGLSVISGQMIWLSDVNHMIFIGSPRLSSLNEMMERKMYISDIPGYDVTRELVLLNQQRIAEIEVRLVEKR